MKKIRMKRRIEQKRKNFKTAVAGVTAMAVVAGSGYFPVTASAAETPYWETTRMVEVTETVDGTEIVKEVEQTIRHAVLNSKGELVNIGADSDKLSAKKLVAGTMDAQKFGAFEDKEDAENGIVKLTFDVVGKPVEIPGPLDVMIIADESGSLNMYGRAEDNGGASYMPCLNKDHAYLAGNLQKELYEIALLRMEKVNGGIDETLKQAVSDALAKETAEEQTAALEALLQENEDAIAVAEVALEEAQTALVDAENIHKPFQGKVDLAKEALDLAQAALDVALEDLAEEQAALDEAKKNDDAAQSDLAAKETILAKAEAALNDAQDALDKAKAALEAATNTQDVSVAADAVEEALDALAETVDVAALEAAVKAAEAAKEDTAKALKAAQDDYDKAEAAKEDTAEALEAAQDAYDAAYAADEEVVAAAAVLAEAQAAYDAAVEEAKETKEALEAAQAVADEKANDLENAKNALAAKDAQIKALVKVDEIEKKLAEGTFADVYFNPYDGGMAYTVFKSWSAKASREIVECVEFADGTPANIDIPEILTDDDVKNALFYNWDKVTLNKNGALAYTNKSYIHPDTAHCYFKDGAYVLIPQPENTDMVAEEGKPYSYWSPDYDNPYGCYDRMIIEKEGIVSLAKKVLKADPNNRVAYVGFTRGAYPSLTSYGLGNNGFCGPEDDDLDEMLNIMANTNGHDYTNYAHAMYMARKIISLRKDQNRPCYVVFISDGVPSTSASFKDPAYLIENGGWSVLNSEEGDYPWYDDVYPVNTTTYPASEYPQGAHPAGAEKLAGYFKGYLKETAEDIGFYTVGFSTDDVASDLLEAMAMDENCFFNCKDVDDFMDDMKVVQQDIMTCYPSGSLTDKIGEDFDLLVDEDHPFTVDGTEYESIGEAEEDERVQFAAEGETESAWDVSVKLDNVDEDGVQISFYVQLDEEELNKFEDGTYRVYDTNADSDTATGAKLNYGKLIPDNTKSVGYYTEPLRVSMETPQMRIENGEVIIPDEGDNDGNTSEDKKPSGGNKSKKEEGMVLGEEEIIEPEVPVALPEEDGMVLGAQEEEEGMVAGIAETGDSKMIIFAGAGMVGALGAILALRKKED